MYSRSRLPPAGYRSSVPPQYSGNLFQPVRREKTEHYFPPEPAAPSPETEETVTDVVLESQVQEKEYAKDALPVSDGEEKLPDKKRQEDKILLGVLLLLSAEHEHAMDMIVILLLLLGIR